MASSTVTGLGTGLDITSIVKSLVDAEKAPKANQISNQRTATNATLSALGTLQSALDSFQSSLAAINKASSFAGLAATSSDTGVATVSSDEKAVAGTYTVKVNNLATGSKVVTASIDGGNSAKFSKGVITIKQGDNSYPVNIDEGASLQDIRDAINTRYQSAGLSANIVTDASGGTRLVLGSTTTGAGTDISLEASDSSTATGDNTSLAKLAIPADQAYAEDGSQAGYIGEKAKNASFSIDGLVISSASNKVEDTIGGLSLNLVKEGTTTVSISTNTSGLKSSIQSFVMAYNTLITATNALTKVSTSTTDSSDSNVSAAALTGDASVRSLLNAVREQLVSPSTDGGSINLLSQLGISTQKDGTLSIDDTKLTSALSANAASVAGYFTGDGGLLSRLSSAVDVYASDDGILAKRQSSLQNTLSDLNDQETKLNTRIDKLQTTLLAKYNAMDTLVAQLNATSNSVLTTLNALNNQKND
nr:MULTISPECIES: flagellar filament capping protein FliD [Pseudomonas]